jgi:hypothetical protein
MFVEEIQIYVVEEVPIYVLYTCIYIFLISVAMLQDGGHSLLAVDEGNDHTMSVWNLQGKVKKLAECKVSNIKCQIVSCKVSNTRLFSSFNLLLSYMLACT